MEITAEQNTECKERPQKPQLWNKQMQRQKSKANDYAAVRLWRLCLKYGKNIYTFFFYNNMNIILIFHMWKSCNCSHSKSTPLCTFNKCLVQTTCCIFARNTPLHSFISLYSNTHTNTKKLCYLRSSLSYATAQAGFLHRHHLYCTVHENQTKPDRLNLTMPLPRRVRPKWSVLVIVVTNALPPREAACMKARRATMVTCGTAQAVSSVPATGARSSARRLSVAASNVHRWVWNMVK